MTGSEQRSKWLYYAFSVILSAAMDRDGETVADRIGDVGMRFGHKGVYAICRAMAESIRVLGFPDFERGDGSLTGEIAIIVGDGSKNPNALWATRFVTAYLNGDDPTTDSLFFGMLDADAPQGDELVARVIALISMAAALARKAEQS